jgi:hypothetical protein
MVQLHSKFAQNVPKDWMWWHTKPGSKKAFENDHTPWGNSERNSPST